jgi:hypothetical protein
MPCKYSQAASNLLHSYRAALISLLREGGRLFVSPMTYNLTSLAVVLFMQVVNLKNGSVMKYLDPTTKQITGMVYCPQERAVLTASSNGQVGAHSVVAVGCFCALCCRFLVLLFTFDRGVREGNGRSDFVMSSPPSCLLHLLQLRVCEEDSLEGYRPAAGDDDAFYSTLRRK